MMESPEVRPGRPVVQSVARALALLEAVGAREEVALSVLAREAGLRPSTAHRLLATLIDCGYVVQDARSGRYRLSHKVVELAGVPELRVARLRAVAQPHLEAIRDRSDETTNLVVLEGHTVAYVGQAESARAVRMFTELGRRVVAHATGGGKALLAFQPEQVRAALLAAAPYARLTQHTITTRAALRKELAAVRARGYAVEREEHAVDVGCVGVPVLDADGHAIAAISVSAPLARLEQLDVPGLARAMAGHTLQMARELGYEAPVAVAGP
jgi:IclR family acetate operon transcriptional repressor